MASQVVLTPLGRLEVMLPYASERTLRVATQAQRHQPVEKLSVWVIISDLTLSIYSALGSTEEGECRLG